MGWGMPNILDIFSLSETMGLCPHSPNKLWGDRDWGDTGRTEEINYTLNLPGHWISLQRPHQDDTDPANDQHAKPVQDAECHLGRAR